MPGRTVDRAMDGIYSTCDAESLGQPRSHHTLGTSVAASHFPLANLSVCRPLEHLDFTNYVWSNSVDRYNGKGCVP